MSKTPEEVLKILELIDHNYAHALAKGWSRMSIDWGMWSFEMNSELRKRIEAGHEHSHYYKYLFIYWVNRSQLLESHFKAKGKKFWGHIKRKRLSKEGKDIHFMIETGRINPEDLEEVTFKELVSAFVKKEERK